MGDFFKNAGTAVIIAAAAILFVLIISGCTGSVSYYDENGKFNRWLHWGPFAELVEMLETMNLMDNKISVEYENGLFIGFYDGKVQIGTKCWHVGDHNYVKPHEDILNAYKRYKEKFTAEAMTRQLELLYEKNVKRGKKK